MSKKPKVLWSGYAVFQKGLPPFVCSTKKKGEKYYQFMKKYSDETILLPVSLIERRVR